MKKIFLTFMTILCALLMTSCKERSVGVGVVGFNHTNDKYINTFSVNGAPGPNVGPKEGGGKKMCCVSLPAEWRPGMQVKIWWQYGRLKDDDPALPPRQIELDVPKYGKSVGDVHVHFYANDKIKLVISNCDAEHPFYPLDKESLLPWKADRSKEEHLKWEKEVGAKHDC